VDHHGVPAAAAGRLRFGVAWEEGRSGWLAGGI
jgi:hypothetical protein